jgi:hypothetical protein
MRALTTAMVLVVLALAVTPAAGPHTLSGFHRRSKGTLPP